MSVLSSHAPRYFSSLCLKGALTGLLGLFLLGACASEISQGEGPLKQEERNLGAFDTLQVNQSYIVEIEWGKPQKLVVEADESLLPFIETKLESKTLIIQNKTGKVLRSHNPIKIFLSVPLVQHVHAKGASRLVFTGLTGDKLALDLEGGHQVRMVGGVLQNLQIKVNGGARLESLMLQAQNVDIQLNGGASARIRVERKLKVKAAGASKVEYKGTPEITQNLTGMSVLRKL